MIIKLANELVESVKEEQRHKNKTIGYGLGMAAAAGTSELIGVNNFNKEVKSRGTYKPSTMNKALRRGSAAASFGLAMPTLYHAAKATKLQNQNKLQSAQQMEAMSR